MSVAIPLREDYSARQLRGFAKKTKDGPQARLCVPKTSYVSTSWLNCLTSADNGRVAKFRPCHLGLTIQVEEPT